MVTLFISYRRADSAQVTGRIYDKLVGVYGSNNVFKDVDSIPLGTDFRRVIEECLGRCDALLAVVGASWLNATDQSGLRRIDNAHDYVRIEIEFALSSGTPVIPLLVDNTPMPLEKELPQSLHDFAHLNATAVRPDPDFHRDMERVIRALGPSSDRPNHSPRGALASNVILIDASLDPNDSPYDQMIVDGTKTIRPKPSKPGGTPT